MKIKEATGNSPFDQDRRSTTENAALTVKHVKPARFMTTRASVFMGSAIISANFAIACDNNYITTLIMMFVCAAFYAVTFRFIKFPKRLLNGLFFIFCPLIFWGVYFADISFIAYIPETIRPLFHMSPVFPLCFIPMAAGLAGLSVITPDGSGDESIPSVRSEVLIPTVYAAAAACVGSFIAGLPERRTVFAANILSVLFLIGIAAILSSSTKSPKFFTSKRLTEYWDIPVADVSELRRFFFARAKFIIALFATSAILYLVKTFFGDIAAPFLMPIAIVSSIILGTAMIAAGRPGDVHSIFGTKFFLFEMLIGAAFVCVPFAKTDLAGSLVPITGLFLFFACAGDFFISGLIAVIRRRQIFVEKNKYTDGLPFMMILLSLLIMAAEAMFPVV
ncbi:MAG: hypothetical protein J6X33_01595 [Clostridiales bacterium]|nr:hypothetical protein [Clostridiales bacterium]